jgi:hypothetical protein
MVDRVFVGNDGGAFKMRVSRPGFDARTAGVNGLVIHEGMRPLIPVATGLISVGAGSRPSPASASVSLGIGFAFPPKLVLRNNINTLPGSRTYYARLDLSNGILTITNEFASAMVVRYTIYNPI